MEVCEMTGRSHVPYHWRLVTVFLLIDTSCCLAFSLPGIWKLSLSDFTILRPKSTLDRLRNQLLANFYEGESGKEKEESVLIKLNPDGSFRQCTEGFQEGRWISGRWRLRTDDNKLLFALDRQYYGPPSDVLLEGDYYRDSRKVNGQVYVGKFMYHKHHPCFFDQPIPISMKNETGSFFLEQAVATTSVVRESPKRHMNYSPSVFFDRSFYLVSSPLESPTRDNRKEDTKPFDILAMRISFHANHTFQAFGYNKILRGRYGVRFEDESSMEVLWFQVSLFGAGRSAPGSVYSEGSSLQKEDEKMYVGEILADNSTLVVQGTAMVGSDLGSDARPEPVGRFRMVEITEHDDA